MPKNIILIFLITLTLTLSLANLAWAQGSGGSTGGQSGGSTGGESHGSRTPEDTNLQNPLGTASVATIIGRIIKAFLGIIGTISLVMFIYGGITLLTSAGASGKIKTGQQTLVWASLGILVVFASYAILKFVFSAFGL